MARTLSQHHNPRTSRPLPVPEADWQPGAIAGSERKRIYLNGEPIAGAIAASYVRGWVIVTVGEDGDVDPLNPGRAGSTRRLEGYVEIR